LKRPFELISDIGVGRRSAKVPPK